MGIDIGTSGVKSVVFDSNGMQLCDAYCEYATVMPGEGRAELDSNLVLDSCLQVISQAAQQVREQDPVESLGISSQGEAFTTIDASGNILSNAMVSFDTRATEIAKMWSDEFGCRRLYEITGHTAHPMFSLFKLLWIKNNQPEVWNNARFFYCFEDLLHWKLGLQPAISYPMAGRTMMFNVIKHEWDEEILSAVGINANNLARPLPSGSVVGTLSNAMAEKLGLAKNAIVVTGGHDQPCGALGAGILTPGKAMYGMGTVECICPAFDEPVFGEQLYQSNLCTYDFTAAGMYTTIAFSLTGGNLLRWYRDQWATEEKRLAAEHNIDPYDAIINSMSTTPSSLHILPYFTPSGTPYFETEPFAAVLGLTLETDRGEVLRGLLEAVSLEMKLNVNILSQSGIVIDQFIAIGGGARGRKLVQLKADVLNRPITTVLVTEAGCLGVAMLAACAKTGENLKSIAERWVRTGDVINPDPALADFYEDKFQKYLLLYPELRKLREKL